jgi:glycosyltransferase involved in cell wall biosynthesis
MHPLVSVSIITYNHEKFIGSAIESLLSQTYPNIEIIISDDASTDNTLEVINSYIATHSDRIKLLKTKRNLGANANWFKAVSVCNGKYVVGLAGDDEFLPELISKQVSIMESDEDIVICYADALVFDVYSQKSLYLLSDKAPTLSGNVKIALEDSIYYSPTTMFRKKYLPKINIFEGIRHGSDLAFYKELMILAAPNGKIHYLPEVLYKYQKHGSNITVTEHGYRKEHIDCIRILQDKYPIYKESLAPSIYDFCCVAFFKSLMRLNFKDAYYFLVTGLEASRWNIFKFIRSIKWGACFYIKVFFKSF